MLKKVIFLPRMLRLCKSFSKFSKKSGGSNFSLKNGGVGKIGGIVLKKGRGITCFYTNPFPFPVLSFSECVVCVCICVCVHVCVYVCVYMIFTRA